MKYEFRKLVIVTLGGSILFPEKIDTAYISSFRKFILSFRRSGVRFIIVIGGGRVCRIYQEAAAKVMPVSDEDKDWIGIHSTRLNAQLLRTILKDVADPVVVDGRNKIKKSKYFVTVASGWRPGWSTDYVAAALAEDFKAKEYIVAGKPAYVYSRDPQKYRNVKKFEFISWKDYRNMTPGKWIPGAHAPVDPMAARLSESGGIKAIVINGKNLKNFKNLLTGREFEGTVVG